MLWYLATPYSRYRKGIATAFVEACQQAALLLGHGVSAYSPIAHTHPVAIHGGLDPYDHSTWLPFDEKIMTHCDGLIVCKMDGWDSSVGIAHEVDWFATRGHPVVYMEPGVVPEEVKS